ncbi:hypothetical protein [Streptomyces sp. NPDC047990]|uniref:hypothetical protein n=1 Tax=Streptomyces sp. NPDC047990 TaxID=3365496 RepID=UPI00371C01CD
MAVGILPDLFVVLEWTTGEAGVRLSIGETDQRFEDFELSPPELSEGFVEDQVLTDVVKRLVPGRVIRTWEALEVMLNAGSGEIAWFGPADMPSSVRQFFEAATA